MIILNDLLISVASCEKITPKHRYEIHSADTLQLAKLNHEVMSFAELTRKMVDTKDKTFSSSRLLPIKK
jgi:hypothetical protein